MDEEALLAALQHADAAGDTKTAQSIAAQLQSMGNYDKVDPVGDTALRGSADASTPAAAAPAAEPQVVQYDRTGDAPAAGMSTYDRSQEGQPDAEPITSYDRKALEQPDAPEPTGQTGNWLDSVNAAVQPFAKDVTFGLAPKAEAGIASLINGVPYSAAQEAVERRDAANASDHPYLNALGHVGGFIEGGKVLGAGLEAAGKAGIPLVSGLARAMVPAEHGSVVNYLKASGLTGGIIGAEDTAVDNAGKDIPASEQVYDAMLGSGAGALTGAVVGAGGAKLVENAGPIAQFVDRNGGKAVNAISKAFGGPAVDSVGAAIGDVGKTASKAWRTMAGKVGIGADDADAYVAQARARGTNPTIQGMLNAKQAGELQAVAGKNPDLATGLQANRFAASEAAPAEMSTAIENIIPTDRPKFAQGVQPADLSQSTILDARDRSMDGAMDAIRTRQVPLDADDFLNTPEFADATRGAGMRDVRLKLADVSDPANATSGHLNVGDIDRIRKNLSRIGTANPGGSHAVMADDLQDATRAAVPEYNTALSDYSDATRYSEGFNHGIAGRTAASATDQSLRNTLNTLPGQQGHKAGLIVNLRDKAKAGADGALDVAKELSRQTATQMALQSASPQGAGSVSGTAGEVAGRSAALAASTPSAIRAAAEGPGLGEAAQVALHAGAGMHLSAMHKVGRAIGTFMGSNTFTPEVQHEIAGGLTSMDPRTIDATILKLRQAGLDNASLRKLESTIAGMGGQAASQGLNEVSQ